MSDVKITVGGRMEEAASRRFIDGWHRGERGETFHERHLAFESWDALVRVLTGKRLELLRHRSSIWFSAGSWRGPQPANR